MTDDRNWVLFSHETLRFHLNMINCTSASELKRGKQKRETDESYPHPPQPLRFHT